MTHRPEEIYDRAHPVRTLARMFRGQGGKLSVATVAFAVKHSPIWIIPLLTANVIDIVVQLDRQGGKRGISQIAESATLVG